MINPTTHTEPTPPRAEGWLPGDVANGHRLHEDGVWRPLPSAAPMSTKTKIGWAVAVVSMIAVIVISLSFSDGSGGSKGSGSATVSSVTHLVVNPSTITVYWRMEGDPGDIVPCRVEASDPSHHYTGSHSGEVTLHSDGTAMVHDTINISHDGAAWADDVSVDCSQ